MVSGLILKLMSIENNNDGSQMIPSHEESMRERFRESYLNDPWIGTIEERLLDGYLYCMTTDDLSLSREELMAIKTARRIVEPERREVFVQTGKAGVMTYVKMGKEQGDTEEEIAKRIWVEMIIDGVQLYVNIKCLKVKNDDEKNTNQEESSDNS